MLHNRRKRHRTSKHLKTLAIALFLFVAILPAAASAQDGAALFDANCASCHGPDGTGLMPGQPDFTSADFWNAESQEELIDAVTNGVQGTAMPAFQGQLSEDEIRAVLEHESDFAGVSLASLPETGGSGEATGGDTGGDTGGAAPTIPEGDANRGKQLFTGEIQLENGGPACISCHNVAGTGALGGGQLARDLTDVHSRLGGDAGLYGWLATPPAPIMKEVFSADNKPLADQERADLVAFFKQAHENEGMQDTASTPKFAGAGIIGFIIIAVIFSILWRNRFTKRNNGTVHDDLWRNYGGKK